MVVAVALAATTPVAAAGQAESPAGDSSLEFLVGSWEGELEYLDYGDDRTLVRLPTSLVARAVGDTVHLEFSFTEPDGSVVTSRERIYESSEGIHLDVLWQVERRVHDVQAGRHRLVLVRDGEDGGRPATVTDVVALEGGELTITRRVRYAEAAEPLQRHQFRLTRTR